MLFLASTVPEMYRGLVLKLGHHGHATCSSLRGPLLHLFRIVLLAVDLLAKFQVSSSNRSTDTEGVRKFQSNHVHCQMESTKIGENTTFYKKENRKKTESADYKPHLHLFYCITGTVTVCHSVCKLIWHLSVRIKELLTYLLTYLDDNFLEV